MKIFEEGLKELGARFFLIGLLPSTFLAAVVAAAVDPAPWLRLLAEGGEAGAAAAPLTALLVGALLLSLVLAAVQLPMIRLLEGYWPERRPFRRLAERRTARHRERLARLKAAQDVADPNDADTLRRAQQAAFAVHHLYPADARRVMPTRLGNILRAGEDGVGARYGLDAVVIWPRLYAVLSDQTRGLVEDQRLQLDLCVRLVYVFAASALAALVGALRFGNGWAALGAALLVGLAVVAYRASQTAALSYVTLFQTAFDLHRHALFNALRLQPASNLEAEREQNRILSRFLREGVGNLEFAAPAAKEGERR